MSSLFLARGRSEMNNNNIISNNDMWRNENKSRVYMRMQSKWASEFDKSISFQQQYWICMIIAAIPKIPHVLYTLNSTPLDEREREIHHREYICRWWNGRKWLWWWALHIVKKKKEASFQQQFNDNQMCYFWDTWRERILGSSTYNPQNQKKKLYSHICEWMDNMSKFQMRL